MRKNIRRNNLRIMVDILKVSNKQPINISNIVFKANLNFLIAHKYIDKLRKSGLLILDNRKYKTTSKGISFIGKIENIIGDLK